MDQGRVRRTIEELLREKQEAPMAGLVGVPLVNVLANMVHFFLGLIILAGFLIAYRHWPEPPNLIWFPVVVAIQLARTLIQRQLALSTSQPPSTGPRAGAIAVGTVSTADACARSFGGKARNSIVVPTGVNMPPPMPWSKRNTISD